MKGDARLLQALPTSWNLHVYMIANTTKCHFLVQCNEGKVRSNLFYNVDLNGYSIPPTTPYLCSIEGVFFLFLKKFLFLLMHFLANLKVYLKMMLFPLKIKIILSPPLFIIHKMNSIFSNCLWLMSFDDEIYF